MSAHPQDLVAPHMDRVQLVMSWYTDGPGGGTEWYRVVESGTEWYREVQQQMMSGGH